MARPLETEFDISPDSAHRVKVFIHRTERALFEAAESPCRAVCSYGGENWEHLVELHFWRDDIAPSLVTHEAFHAALVFGRTFKASIALNNINSEEAMASACQNIVEKTLEFCRLHKIKLRRE